MNKLKIFRASRDLSGADMAKVLQITPVAYYKIENGDTKANVNHIRKIREAFHLSDKEVIDLFCI